ncbi:hypothetical protein [Streptosporangium sp. NPDC048865]|uniref:hypothetical protein n=1 Tax=Streptosporangium sp. NPDC048865 TaxID=3155766 RepID=UPI0034285E42
MSVPRDGKGRGAGREPGATFTDERPARRDGAGKGRAGKEESPATTDERLARRDGRQEESLATVKVARLSRSP